MEDVATTDMTEHDEDTLFLNDVAQGDPELYFLHTYLHESFGTMPAEED